MFCYYDSPIGVLEIEEDGEGICKVQLIRQSMILYAEWDKPPLLAQAVQELEEYFSGKRKVFDLPLSYHGTPFQVAVWEELRKIPYGETRNYGQIATAIGNPKAARAVGMANNRNHLMIVVPCHRVIGKDGRLVGYAGGVDTKEKLLTLEKEGGL